MGDLKRVKLFSCSVAFSALSTEIGSSVEKKFLAITPHSPPISTISTIIILMLSSLEAELLMIPNLYDKIGD
jgi:hypothetical protein